jgi:hypothetical protein
MGSVLIELLDSHERIVTARRALRRATTAERGRRTGRDDA